MSREERILAGVGRWCAYYRRNPHRFAKDYLHLELHLFQKILIVMMNHVSNFVFIGSRGCGKSFLSAVFCVVRCILYPGTKICIASGTRGQSVNVLEKIIMELKPNSPELAAELNEKESQINGTNAKLVFKNSSYIKVVTASDSARGNRSNLLLIDEFRMVSKDVIDTILRKFLTQKRMPRYEKLTKEERIAEYAKERNKLMYLSSAYFMDHWSYAKCTDTCKLMLDDARNQFICGIPYQLSVAEGLLDADMVQEEMLEQDFNEIKFSMEYESVFFGSTDSAFFSFDTINKNRKVECAMLPDRLASLIPSVTKFRIPPKRPGELRLLSADIALMATTRHKNDATAIFINQCLPTKAGRFANNIVYTEVHEGSRTDEEALSIRRLYEEFDCDYIILDVRNIGLSIYDALARDMPDVETGEVYPALSCCNNAELAARCTSRTAEKKVWAIQGSSKMNSDCALMLREGFRSGRIRLLRNEYDAEEDLKTLKVYNSMPLSERAAILLPYVNTTLLVNELINLRHEEINGVVRVSEKSGMRKDRYSSLSYNYYVSTILETQSRRRNALVAVSDDMAFVFRAPKNYKGRR